MTINIATLSVAQAQSLRKTRMMWGVLVQACTALVIGALYAMDMVPGLPVLIYLAMIVTLDIGFFTIVQTGFNLRFKDPSLTLLQIELSIIPIIYIMFFVTDPQARIALLLMGTSSLMFGMFGLRRDEMLLVVASILTAYLSLLLALALWTPERINLPAEIVIVLAYACVLIINAYLASIVSGMRRELKVQNRELAELASLDSLTRLPNRRSLMAHLKKESARSERREAGEEGLCVAMLDVDHFKKINDTWGHETGDRILCEIGDALQELLREYDFVGRYGGEEFLIVLSQTSLNDAHALATRMRDAIDARQFQELPAAQITVSLGIADYRSGERIEDCLKRADEALYRAKKDGRNRVAY